MKQAKMRTKATMMVMNHQNMMIHKIMMTEKNLKMKMPTKRERRNSVKKEKKRYEKRRSHLKNSVK